MQIRYIDYKVTENGLVELSNESIRQTEHNIHRMRVYADFDNSGSSPYLANIDFLRADRLPIGPIALKLAQDDEGEWHRYCDIPMKLTEIVGPLKFGIAYLEWEENEHGVLVLKKQFPIFASLQYVFDTNKRVYERDYDIYQRLLELEGVDSGYFSERLGVVEDEIPQIYEAIENIEVGVSEGVIKLETIEEANASPKAQKAGSIAFIEE